MKKKKKTDRKSEILSIYLKLVRSLGRIPTRANMLDMGVTRDSIRTAYNSLEALEIAARTKAPETFENIVDRTSFTSERFEALKKDSKKFYRFVVTTAVCGQGNLDVPFFLSIKKFCKLNNAKLLVIPVQDPANRWAKHSWNLDSRLKDEAIIFSDLSLNSNISVRTIKLSAKQIDPVTGLDRLGQQGGSFIFGSPKQRMRTVAVGEGKLPHIFMSTGAITTKQNSYEKEYYFSQRTAYLAEHDHIVGAIIVEIQDDNTFHFRQIQSDNNGHFYDLGIKYTQTSKTFVGAEGFILGDWHSGVTDKTAARAWKEVSEEVKPRRLVIHDFLDGRFNNHHDVNSTITRARLAMQNKISLQRELERCIRDLNKLSALAETIVIVRSNHDEVIERYIQDGRYLTDPINLELASKLVSPMIQGKMCLQYLMENLHTLCNTKERLTATNIVWLRRDDSYFIEGVECGAHGDVGSNGARGSIRSLELAYGNCVVGHSHSPEILRTVYRVGTSSIFRLPYVKGPSSWMHTSCLIHKGGARQLINSINGDWRIYD